MKYLAVQLALSWTHPAEISPGDVINSVIAVTAVLGFAGTLSLTRRHDEFVVRQINREERIKLYTPLLALLRTEWIGLDIEILNLQDPALENPNPKHDEEHAALDAKIRNYEYEAAEDLLGSPAIRKKIDAWLLKANECDGALNKYRKEEQLMIARGQGEDDAWLKKRKTLFDQITSMSMNLKEGDGGLDELRSFMQAEIGLTQEPRPRFWGVFRQRFRGTTGAQENGNG